MTQNKLLTKEIIRHIFTSFGIGPNIKIDNMLKHQSLLTSKIIKAEYEEFGEIEHPIYSGQMMISQDTKFKAVFADLSLSENDIEYCCVFCVDKLPIYGLHLNYSDVENLGFFRVYNDQSKSWIDAPISIQAMSLVGVENIVSYGLLWEPCNDFDSLYKAVIALAV